MANTSNRIKLPLVIDPESKPIVHNCRRQRNGEGNVFSRVCLSTGGGVPVRLASRWLAPYWNAFLIKYITIGRQMYATFKIDM